jgi:tetratricopeptide (TPR) repeat protein
MRRNIQTGIPHPALLFLSTILLQLLTVPERLGHFIVQNNKEDLALIDSIFRHAHQSGLDTNGVLRYQFCFSDPETGLLEKFIVRMEKDTFELLHMKQKGKDYQVCFVKNDAHTRGSLYKLQRKLKFLKYSHHVDHYDGFRIEPPDPDPFGVLPERFMTYIKSLDEPHLYRAGERLWYKREWDKALNALALASRKPYKQDTALYRYGQVLIALHEYNDGIDEWEKALQVNPAYVEVYMSLGKLKYENGYFESALSHFEKANVLQPGDDEILYRLAETHYQLEQYNRSYAFAKQSFQLNRKHVYTKSLLTLLKTPRVKYLRKKFPEK